MKEKMRNSIDEILKMASMQENKNLPSRKSDGARPDNSLSRSIRSKKDADQFQAELKAVISLRQ